MKKEVQIEINRRNYTTPDQKYVLRPKNAVFLSAANSIRHEIFKVIGGLMLLKYGDISLSLKLKRLIWDVEQEIKESMKNFPKEHTDFITEACPSKDRRVDLVRLNDCQHYEFECDHTIKKEGAFTFYI